LPTLSHHGVRARCRGTVSSAGTQALQSRALDPWRIYDQPSLPQEWRSRRSLLCSRTGPASRRTQHVLHIVEGPPTTIARAASAAAERMAGATGSGATGRANRLNESWTSSAIMKEAPAATPTLASMNAMARFRVAVARPTTIKFGSGKPTRK
jgi:hypothetical protein